MKNNAYFDHIREVCTKHNETMEAHKATKDAILEKFGWDSEEIREWYARKKEIEDSFPYSSGAMKAYRTWYWCESEELEVNDFCWEREIHDFITALREAGIKSFVYTNQSTAVMENIHGFIGEGCTMEGPCVLEKKSRRWGEEEIEKVLGLRFKVN